MVCVLGFRCNKTATREARAGCWTGSHSSNQRRDRPPSGVRMVLVGPPPCRVCAFPLARRPCRLLVLGGTNQPRTKRVFQSSYLPLDQACVPEEVLLLRCESGWRPSCADGASGGLDGPRQSIRPPCATGPAGRRRPTWPFHTDTSRHGSDGKVAGIGRVQGLSGLHFPSMDRPRWITTSGATLRAFP